MSSPRRTLAVLAASHGFNDLVAGWLLASYWTSVSSSQWFVAFTLYSAIAFGGQALAATWIERKHAPRLALTLSFVGLAVALATARIQPLASIVISGIVSALVHVAGGVLALRLPRGERSFGWFCAPGVLGVTLGGWLGHGFGAPLPWMALAAVVMLGLWLRSSRDDAAFRSTIREHAIRIETTIADTLRSRDALVLLLLLALVLRSAVWDFVQSARSGENAAIAALATSAALGKVLGGVFVERWRSVRALALVLVIASALLDLGGGTLVMSCAGVALLQSTIPAAVVLMQRSFRISASSAVAWGLGVSVALGGLLSLAVPAPAVLRALPLLALVLVWRENARDSARASRWVSGVIE